MRAVEIPVAAIDDSNRARPVTGFVAEQLAWDIEARGLRQPIEVAATRPGEGIGAEYRLVSGGHRLAAFKRLNRETIPAFVVTGDPLVLRRDELLENLARNELSALERAQFLAELKRVYQALHPDAKNGGDRTTEQSAKLANWYRDVAQRSGWAVRTIERAAQIGERIAPEAAELLRGTPFEDKQSELALLAKAEPTKQPKIAALVARKQMAEPSIRAAIARVEGRTQTPASTDDRSLAKLLDAWSRAPMRARRAFIQTVMDGEFRNEAGDVLAWVPDYDGDE